MILVYKGLRVKIGGRGDERKEPGSFDNAEYLSKDPKVDSLINLKSSEVVR